MSSLYGVARKPYIPIDTSSPGGTWIEEQRFNKHRPADVPGRQHRIFCGNWQEEMVLEEAMKKAEAEEAEQEEARRKNCGGDDVDADAARAARRLANQTGAGMTATVSTQVIRDRGNGHYTGGFASSRFLTADCREPQARHLLSTHQEQFNPENGDVHKLKRPHLGVRSQALLRQAMQAATEDQDEANRQRELQWASAIGKGQTGVGGTTNLAAGDLYRSSYHTAHCAVEELPTVEALRDDYLGDEPITIYTGNPDTGKTMTVHGKTPQTQVEDKSRFGRHTYFTEPKYAL